MLGFLKLLDHDVCRVPSLELLPADVYFLLWVPCDSFCLACKAIYDSRLALLRSFHPVQQWFLYENLAAI